MERGRALSHEATAHELRQQLSRLQEQRRGAQLQHARDMDALLAQVREAQERLAEAGELRQRAESRYLTARASVVGDGPHLSAGDTLNPC